MFVLNPERNTKYAHHWEWHKIHKTVTIANMSDIRFSVQSNKKLLLRKQQFSATPVPIWVVNTKVDWKINWRKSMQVYIWNGASKRPHENPTPWYTTWSCPTHHGASQATTVAHEPGTHWCCFWTHTCNSVQATSFKDIHNHNFHNELYWF